MNGKCEKEREWKNIERINEWKNGRRRKNDMRSRNHLGSDTNSKCDHEILGELFSFSNDNL